MEFMQVFKINLVSFKLNLDSNQLKTSLLIKLRSFIGEQEGFDSKFDLIKVAESVVKLIDVKQYFKLADFELCLDSDENSSFLKAISKSTEYDYFMGPE